MKTFLRLVSYSRPYWWRILIAALCSMLVGGMDGAFAYISGPLMKKIFSEQNQDLLLLLPLGIIAIFLLRGMGRFAGDYFIRTAGQLAMQNIRRDIYRSSMYLDLRFFSTNPAGVLMSRVLNDVNAMQEGIGNVITGLFRDGFGALFLLGMIFYLNWKLALIAFLVIPCTVYPAQLIGKRIKSLSRESQGRMGDISAILQETFTGIKVIKAFGLESREVERFTDRNLQYYSFVRRAIKYEGLSVPVMELLTSLGIAAVVWYGGSQVISGAMTPEAFLSFVTAMVLLYNPVKKLNSSYNAAQRAIGAGDRVFEMMDEKREILDPADPAAVGRVAGEVIFRDVSFSYGEEPILQHVSFNAPKGGVVALVGPSGAGKTTIISLISRFYDVTDGAILIDGIDIRDMAIADLMRQIALVDQETVLFNETIANNIRYGRPEATDEEVRHAAETAFAHEFIMEMPDGYATNIGDRGVRLSGGQRQRLCIARAILKDAPILLLDEATSALDTESEQMVQQALNNLMNNRTTFVIAHRLSTVLHADIILVLDRGEIVQKGSHGELMAQGGLYGKLYEMQFRHEGDRGQG